VPELVALLFLAITGWLLIDDLQRPERFLKLIFHPNTKSWLVKGTWVLMAFGGLTTASLAAGLFGFEELVAPLRWVNLPVAAFASGYTALLFAQCRGRDLWIEPGLMLNLIARAAMLGAGIAAMLPNAAHDGRPDALGLLAALALANGLLLRAEMRRHGSTEASRKAHELMLDALGKQVLTPWWAATATALACYVTLSPGSGAQVVSAVVLATVSIVLFRFERAWIRAAQKIPNS